jgi:hypothetical protein
MQSLSEFFARHIFTKVLLSTVIPAGFGIGGELIVDKNNRTAALIVAVAVFLLMNVVFEVINQQDSTTESLRIAEAERNLYASILYLSGQRIGYKHENQSMRIVDSINSKEDASDVYTDPERILQGLLLDTCEAFSQFLKNENNTDFAARMLYKFDEQPWKIAHTTGRGTTEIKKLTGLTSPLSYLMNDLQDDDLLEKKETLLAEKHYYGSGEKSPRGEILCHRVKLHQGVEQHVKAFLEVTSKKDRLPSEEHENLLVIVRHFEPQFCLELGNLYMQFLYDQKQKVTVSFRTH